MTSSRLRVLAAALALGMTTSGCATTGLVNRWTLPGFQAPMKSMLVIAMKRKDVNRRILEDAFVAELAKHGVTATASYTVFPVLPDTESVREYVRANRPEGVLVAARLPTEEQSASTPSYATSEVRTGYNTWTGRYYTYYLEVDHDPTTQTQRVVPHRVDVWYAGVKGGQMVWTAEARTVDPSSAAQSSREVCRSIVTAMAKAGVIPAKR